MKIVSENCIIDSNMCTVDKANIIISKPIQNIQDLFSIFPIVEEKLLDTNRLMLLLYENVEDLHQADIPTNQQSQSNLGKEEEDALSKVEVVLKSEPPEDNTSTIDDDLDNTIDESLEDEEEKIEIDNIISDSQENEKISSDIKNGKKKKEKSTFCAKCNQQLSSITTFQAHNRRWHNHIMRTYVCSYCGLEMTLPHRSKFKRHYEKCKIKTLGIKFICEQCGVETSSDSSLKNHKRMIHEKRPIVSTCPFCHKKIEGLYNYTFVIFIT